MFEASTEVKASIYRGLAFVLVILTYFIIIEIITKGSVHNSCSFSRVMLIIMEARKNTKNKTSIIDILLSKLDLKGLLLNIHYSIKLIKIIR